VTGGGSNVGVAAGGGVVAALAAGIGMLAYRRWRKARLSA
jgi:LPXTG-motif cell wall-anchored protein